MLEPMEGGRLLLVGAGHAHLEILRRLILEPLPGVALTMVSLGELHHYSGMVPGYLQGTYWEEEIAIRVPDLARRARGSYIAARAVGVDPARRTVRVEIRPGEACDVPYDFASFAVGSNTAGIDASGVTEEARRIKPMERVVSLFHQLWNLAGSAEPVHAVVVGGGAAGVEVALAMAAVFEKTRTAHQITILEAGGEILSHYPERFRRRARRVLERRGIAIRTGSRVIAVHAEEVETERDRFPSRLTVWLTGAMAWPLFRDSGLPLDERGFLLIDNALRSIGDPRIFAAGDCGTLANHPWTPKAGVYAVREAPVLWESLKAAVHGSEPPRYAPQKKFLSLLNTGDGRALMDYKGLVSHSRWAWWLKDRIDRGFMRRYQELVE
jgi:selenide, water dikinase